MMDLIYTSANHTLIYLGPSPTPQEAAFFNFVQTSDPTNPDVDLLTAVTASALRSGILSRPWFSRTWIFQELILSGDPWVQISRQHRMKWEDFYYLLQWDGEAREFEGVTAEQNMLMRMGLARLKQNKRNLLELLKARRGMGATDPRDVVYAHLGIATNPSDGWKEFVKVDYGRTVGEVYWDVGRYVIEKHSRRGAEYYDSSHRTGMEELLDNLEEGRRNKMEGLPSWVPDWSKKKKKKTNWKTEAWKRSWSFPSQLPIVPDDVMVLITSGFRFDRIERLGPEAPLLFDLEERKGMDERRAGTAREEYEDLLWAFCEEIYSLGVGNPVFKFNAYRRYKKMLPLKEEEPISREEMVQPLKDFRDRYQLGDVVGPFIEECFNWVLQDPPVLQKVEIEIVSENIWTGTDTNVNQLDLAGSRLAVTSLGRLGAVPVQTQVGDICAAVSPVVGPIILRPVSGPPAGSDLEQKLQQHITRASSVVENIYMMGGGYKEIQRIGKQATIDLGPVGDDAFHCRIVGQAQFQDYEWSTFYRREGSETEKEFEPKLFVIH